MLEKKRNKRLKILFVFPGFELKGGISMVITTIRNSSFSGHFTCQYFGTSSDNSNALARLFKNLVKAFIFPFTLAGARPDIVSIHTAINNSFYRKLVYILISRLMQRKVALHVHPCEFYNYFSNGGVFQKRLVKIAFAASSRVVFLTENMIDQFRSEFPETNMSALPNPVSVAQFSTRQRAPFMGNHTILYLGWIIAEKGVYDIVDIIPQVASEFPDVSFLFAGNKEVDKLKEMIRERGLDCNAKVLGWVEGEGKLDLLKTSRMLLLPSYTEGIPNVVLEAMASGLPAIVTDVGGIPSVFVEGENGYFVRPGDREGLCRTVLMLLQDDEECARISRSTTSRVQRYYDAEIIVEKLTRLYEGM